MSREYWLNARWYWWVQVTVWLVVAPPIACLAALLTMEPGVWPKVLGVLQSVCWAAGFLNAITGLLRCRYALTLFTTPTGEKE